MKKIINTVLFFFLFQNSAFCQISISGILTGGGYFIPNGTYNIGMPVGTPLPTPDIGTNTFSIDNPINGGGIPDYAVMRVSNVWRIYVGLSGGYGPTYYGYDYPSHSTSINPPCSGNWRRFNFGTNVPTGGMEFITITPIGSSSCTTTPSPVGCTSYFCQFISLPQLSTTTISSLVSPTSGLTEAGMFTYDAVKKTPAWFDGFQWQNIYNGIGNYSIGGNLNVTNSLNSNNINNTGTISSSGKIIAADDIIIKGSKQLTFQDAVPSTLYSNTIGTTTGSDFNFTLDGPTVMNVNFSELSISGGLRTNQVSSFNSGIKYPITSVSSSITLNSSNYVVVFTSAVTCTFPPATASNKGQIYKIINHSTGFVSITPSITTGASTTVSSIISGASVEVISDGSIWRKLN